MAPESNTKAVPLLDIKAQYSEVEADLEQNVLAVLRSGSYILGQYGQQLEEQVASLCGTKYGIGVANGTDALMLALWAAGVGPGHEVITPSFTFAATAEAIALRGARPVFVDVDRETFNLDPDKLKAAVNAKTKAVLPVHLYGQPADMEPIMSFAEHYGLTVIEDNAQAIGATYKGRPTGSLGHMSCISFYPTKNLGAAGDAGMIVTSDEELAKRLKRLRAHGMDRRYYHDELGVNSRLDEVQAAVLLAKLPHLRKWNAQRNELAKAYNQALKHVAGITTPSVRLRSSHVWHQYTICIKSEAPITRDEVVAELSKRHIGSMCYYPVPLHLQKAFAQYGCRQGDLPVSEALAREVISLPMYPQMTETHIKIVSTALAEIMAARMVTPVASAATIMGGIY